MKCFVQVLVCVVAIACPAFAQPQAKVDVTEAFRLPDFATNGVARTPDGSRTFLVIAKEPKQNVPQIAEFTGGNLRPYPDAAWNSWQSGDGAGKFVHANSIRFGPDGSLWIVDVGTKEIGKADEKHGPKLVKIDIAQNKVVRVYDLSAATKSKSFVDDVRFHGNNAYITDAGDPAGFIVLDLNTGGMRRVMDGQPTITDKVPLRGEGKQLVQNGKPAYLSNDQLEISPDGKWLYYQPCSGPMSRIETRLLDDPKATDAERLKAAHAFAQTGTAGGTAIDAQGNIYISDTDHNEIRRITPDGQVHPFLQLQPGRVGLIWPDAMWIDAQGYLWIPAAQMNRGGAYNGGMDKRVYPMVVYKAKVGIGPPANDHK